MKVLGGCGRTGVKLNRSSRGRSGVRRGATDERRVGLRAGVTRKKDATGSSTTLWWWTLEGFLKVWTWRLSLGSAASFQSSRGPGGSLRSTEGHLSSARPFRKHRWLRGWGPRRRREAFSPGRAGRAPIAVSREGTPLSPVRQLRGERRQEPSLFRRPGSERGAESPLGPSGDNDLRLCRRSPG